MTENSDKAVPAREKSPWFQIGQILFLVGLAVAVFLLAQSMVHHRFFRGGWINQNGTLRTCPETSERNHGRNMRRDLLPIA
jgi:hypothetical protein